MKKPNSLRINFLCIFLLVFIAGSTTSFSKHDAASCDEKLLKALSISDDHEKIKAVKKILKNKINPQKIILAPGIPPPRTKSNKCANHIPTHIALGDLYQKLGEEEGTDWFQDALKLYLKVIELEAGNVEAKWRTATIFEYLGLYSQAIPHFNWITENHPSIEKQNEAKAHLIVCQFLLKNRGDDITTSEIINSDNIGTIDTSDEAIKKRSGWSFLREVTKAVAANGKLTGLGDDSKYVQETLGHLYGWIDAPKELKVEARNKMLVDMMVTLGSLIIEKSLDMVVGEINLSEIGKELEPLSSEEEVIVDEEVQKELEPDESKTVESWDVPDLNGTWKVSLINGTCNIASHSKPPNQEYFGTIKVNNNQIELILSANGKTVLHKGNIKGNKVVMEHNNSSETLLLKLTFDLNIINKNRLEGEHISNSSPRGSNTAGNVDCSFKSIFTRE